MPVLAKTPAVLLVTDWFDVRFNQGVARFAREHGWSLSLEAAYSRDLPAGWRGDGCVAMISGPATERFVAGLKAPAVDSSHVRTGLRLPRVNDDDRAIGRMAARFFMERGFRHLVFCSPGTNPVAADRLAGFSSGARASGAVVEELLTPGAGSRGEDWAALRRRLRKGLRDAPKPCGVFCVDDRLAAMVCEVAAEMKLRVPGDLSVLGVGNLEIACECSCTPLSSIALDPDAHGYATAALLAEVMAGRHGAWPPRGEPPVRLLPPVGVVERESTRGVAAHDPALARVVARLTERPGEKFSVGALARHAGVGQKRLYSLFADEFRCTPAEFVERTRVNLACRLLKESDRKLPEVARESGFDTPLRLHRAFLRRLGRSPGRWRRLAAAGKVVIPGALPPAETRKRSAGRDPA